MAGSGPSGRSMFESAQQESPLGLRAGPLRALPDRRQRPAVQPELLEEPALDRWQQVVRWSRWIAFERVQLAERGLGAADSCQGDDPVEHDDRGRRDAQQRVVQFKDARPGCRGDSG